MKTLEPRREGPVRFQLRLGQETPIEQVEKAPTRAGILVMAALLLVMGSYTALKMPVDVFPDLTAPTVTVITEARGMAPSEVESQVTFPIEAAVNGASGVRRVALTQELDAVLDDIGARFRHRWPTSSGLAC